MSPANDFGRIDQFLFNTESRNFNHSINQVALIDDTVTIFHEDQLIAEPKEPVVVLYTLDCPRGSFMPTGLEYALLAAHAQFVKGDIQLQPIDDLIAKNGFFYKGDVTDDEGRQLGVFRMHSGESDSTLQTEFWCDRSIQHRIHRVRYKFDNRLTSEHLIEYGANESISPINTIVARHFDFSSKNGELTTEFTGEVVKSNFPDEADVSQFAIVPNPSDWCRDCLSSRVFQFKPISIPFYMTFTFWTTLFVVFVAAVLVIRRRSFQ
ncbi:MAG: hypothetical protein WBD20_19830 [Pirellulaceae bacterium]